ncbi:hypothetical protein HYT53_05590, partial [Candidatus Woesearchaeota archaeon]|nr:hypothetical protein [Candidatus Woesearchaeota archaeon]
GNGNDWLSVVRSGFTISSVSFPNGNVGIGTTSPAANLEVSNGSSASKLIISTTNTGADTATIRLKNSAGAYNDIVEISHGSGRTDFRDGNGLNVMTIDMSDAQLGINDTSPDATLEVGGGTFMVSSTSSGDGDRLIVNSAGNVGIGTTGPLSKLSIGGAGTASADLYIANSNIATIYLDGTTNPSGSQLIIQGRDATVRTTTLSQDSSGLFTINNSGTAGTEFSITTGGNVGIGKTSPNAKLDVAGTVNASSFSTGGFSGSNGRIVAFWNPANVTA